MIKALENTIIFVSSYLVLMALTYYLSSVDSTALAIQTLDGMALSPTSTSSSVPFFLHVSAILVLLWITFARGMAIDKKWMVLLPMVAFAFDFVPKLSTIPIVPSVYHLLAIVVGAASPVVSTLSKSTQ